MGKKHQSNHDDSYGQLAGAIGGLVIVFGVLAAIKDKLGLGWVATVLLTVGALVALGYLAWLTRRTVKRLLAGDTKGVVAVSQEKPVTASEGALADAETVPVHPELTTALTRTGAISNDEVIRAADVQEDLLPGIGTRYTFLLPSGRTHEDVSKRLGPIGSMLGVTRLHLKLETSRQTERQVQLLKLDQPPFTRLFAPPTREEIRGYGGIPLGHEVTGDLGGVETFDKASMLIAGMTQMGKTTLAIGLITCLLIAYGNDFDLYLLDGKICGLTEFHELAVRYEASDDPAVMESMLDDLLVRVESRYAKIQQAKKDRQPKPKFRQVIFIVDEVADFYVDDGTPKSKETVRRVEDKSRTMVAKSLESGISAIMLTQRPDKDAIPVKVRNQFQYRMCLYVASKGDAEVALGDSYFESVAPIPPMRLNPKIKGQGVLYVNGSSTLLRGFNFENDFIWKAIDEVLAERVKEAESYPVSHLTQAIDLMKDKGLDFMLTSDLAPFLGITETDPTEMGKQLKKLLGVTSYRSTKGARGYRLADLTAAAMSGS
ncbi:FtsK/SpoIIIE domain-containing protein (plasmid) [Streptomyces sp. R-74717]|uniref:FtsK/SpoIIIE domain-containing protein n=1 Tax=Streptomyces sp. R-74717 TaxID=2969820 RepID=UPI0039B3D1EC